MDEEEGGPDANQPENKENETRKDSTLSDDASLSMESDATYKVEFNHDAEAGLKLNLVHTFTEDSFRRTFAAFSMDGKYLATVSTAGIVYIFDVETGKRLR